MIEKLFMTLRTRDELSVAEEGALNEALGDVREYAPDRTIIQAGQLVGESILLLDGLMCRYKDLRDGKRQISALHVPGDFVDLHGFTLKRLDHNIMTLTPCRVGVFPHERLKTITTTFPHLTRMLWFLTNLDAAIHREWELSLGRRTALARVAHLFCELLVRLGIVGLTDGSRFRLAITQSELAECLGLTSIHVNRTLRELRERSLVEFRGSIVDIGDLPGLERVAEFSKQYLSMERLPR